VRIDEIVERLTEITTWAHRTNSRMGFFPALYRTVTIEVQRGIADGRFEDPERMERLDVIFARRYLDAFEAHRRGDPVSRSWRLAFDATTRWRPIILQHLLLGMNAHINLDLGIATATVAPGTSLTALRRDFNEINVILERLMNGVESQISSVSPWIDLVTMAAGNVDGVLGAFNLKLARNVAWSVAERLAPLDAAQQAREIAVIDLAAAAFGRALLYPPLLTTAALLLVRGRETTTARDVIDILCEVHPLPGDDAATG
jgi:uncharacterized protein DUF5995